MPSSIVRLLVSLLVFLPAIHFANPASARGYVLSSGAKGGYYHGVASRLVTLLSQEILAARNETSAGSLENLTLLADARSPVNVVLAQADAVRFYLDEHPEFAEELVVLDDLGSECVALITKTKGGIENAADLKTGSFGALVLPSAGSGAAVTLEYMSRMDPAYRQSPVAHREPMEAMLQMRMPGGEKIAAVMLVKRPRTLTPEFEIVLENQEDFRVAPIRPKDVKNGQLPDGSPVYTFGNVKLGFGKNFSASVDTVCTRGLLIGSRSKLSAQSRDLVSRALVGSGRYILPGTR